METGCYFSNTIEKGQLIGLPFVVICFELGYAKSLEA